MTRSLLLAMTGDVMLGRLVAETIERWGFAYPWGDVLPVLHAADLVLVNLECALTRRTELWRDAEGRLKAFYFRADPSAVQTLTVAGIDFVSVANNHIGDFGTDGLLETLLVLTEAGVAYAGAGPNLAAARRPAILTAQASRVAVVAWSDHPIDWAAGPSQPGLNYTPVSIAAEPFSAVERALAEARAAADLVVFSIHWGPNMCARPSESFHLFARRVVEAGADVFWGHSAHVVQGLEVWQGKLILYDTGDFVDDYAVDDELRNDLSALFLLTVEPPHVRRVELVPVQIGHCQVKLARGAERAWLCRRITELCQEFGTRLVPSERGLALPLS